MEAVLGYCCILQDYAVKLHEARLRNRKTDHLAQRGENHSPYVMRTAHSHEGWEAQPGGEAFRVAAEKRALPLGEDRARSGMSHVHPVIRIKRNTNTATRTHAKAATPALGGQG